MFVPQKNFYLYVCSVVTYSFYSLYPGSASGLNFEGDTVLFRYIQWVSGVCGWMTVKIGVHLEVT